MMELEQSAKDRLRTEIEAEIAAHRIIFYGKGTKEMPMCGFTMETCQFLEGLGYPYEVINVLQDMEKRAVLSEMTNWPTLPKVFINGKFYGDTDVLGPMAESGELQTLLKEAFGH
jgi:monothiol glutaredoxin